MKKARPIELLAPAKDVACGIEAINHGADAVYIGAPRFSARAAAGNSVEEIAQLVEYAHQYYAKVYVALNTILHDHELPEVEQLIQELYRIGVDALIVQDFGILSLDLPPIPLHASTQMDNRSPEQVAFLAEAGFQQVVLARELTAEQIAEIHQAVPNTPLEVFVHGALCVSYSGQCYVSQHSSGRSANRGECAQFCRLKFDLCDADGKLLQQGKHLLSLKDMNRSADLELMLASGVSSLKIEGRLKGASYVKNVTAYYRQLLDAIIEKNPAYRRASSGKVTTTFTPHLAKSFNRGFTDYYLQGKRTRVNSPLTPKSLGEPVGYVKETRGNSFNVGGVAIFANGDGLCYFDERGELQGMRINRVENNRLFPQEMPQLAPRTQLYRNFDQAFERTLAKASAERKIAVSVTLSENEFGFSLSICDEDNTRVTLAIPTTKELARSPQAAQLQTQLGKLGGTPFEAIKTEVELSDNWFIPNSLLADARRQLVERLLAARRMNLKQHLAKMQPTSHPFPTPFIKQVGGKAETLSYLGNVMNQGATAFYQQHGVKEVRPAFELTPPAHAVLMTCKYCLREAIGACLKTQKSATTLREPLYLVSTDGKRYRLRFDCKRCEMQLFAAEE